MGCKEQLLRLSLSKVEGGLTLPRVLRLLSGFDPKVSCVPRVSDAFLSGLRLIETVPGAHKHGEKRVNSLIHLWNRASLLCSGASTLTKLTVSCWMEKRCAGRRPWVPEEG